LYTPVVHISQSMHVD